MAAARVQQRADWLCNQALDTRSSFEFVENHIDAYRLPELHWEAFSDGACWGDGHSSVAWIVHVT